MLKKVQLWYVNCGYIIFTLCFTDNMRPSVNLRSLTLRSSYIPNYSLYFSLSNHINNLLIESVFRNYGFQTNLYFYCFWSWIRILRKIKSHTFVHAFFSRQLGLRFCISEKKEHTSTLMFVWWNEISLFKSVWQISVCFQFPADSMNY